MSGSFRGIGLLAVILVLVSVIVIAAPTTNIFTGSLFTVPAGDIENATNITIESGNGIINFTNNFFNLSGIGNVDNFIVIDNGVVGINTTNLTVFNTSARIIMHDLGFLGTPQILTTEDLGNVSATTVCPASQCSGISYNGSSLTFTAQHFSTYVVEEPNGTIKLNLPTEVLLGGESTRASNPQAEEQVNKDSFVEQDLTIINEGAQTITNLNATGLFDSGFSSEALNLTFTFAQTTLAKDQSTTLTVKGRIPENLNAVNETTFKTQAFQVASIQIQGTADNGTITDNRLSLRMQRENQLDLEDIDVCINTKCKNVDNAGDNIEGVRPRDDIEIRILAENQYSNNDAEDLDIEDVTISFDIDDDDLNEDGDETTSSISPQNDHEEIFVFTVDNDVDSGTYDVQILLDGIDENNARHGDEIKFQLDIEKKSRDIEIREARFSPETLVCGATNTKLITRFFNAGTRTEDNAAIEYENAELNLREKSNTLQLDQGRERDVTFTLDIPEGTLPGEYQFKVTTFFEQRFASDQENIKLFIQACEDEESNETEVEEANETVNTLQQNAPPRDNIRITTSLPEKSGISKLAGSSVIWVLGAVMLLIVIGLIVALIKVF